MQLREVKTISFVANVIRCAFLLSFTISLVILTNFGVFAQTQDARISGQVVDQNNAVVTNASITVTNVSTNETRTTVSNGEGKYFISNLRPAVYTVSVTAQGFAANTITDVQLSVGQQLDLPIVMQPQGATVSVTVTSATEAAIDTSSARIGVIVNQREIRDLPLNGRQVSQLELQTPGTVNTGTGTFGDIRFSGRSNQQNIVRYDGVEGTAIIDASPGNLNGEVASPFRLQSSLENIQEFRADSNNYPAELGTGTGGQISVVTKAGTNRFNGTLFEYLRNDKFDARNFFDNVSPGIPKSKLRLNQFGGALGGPIIKDKLFFFGSYEGYRVRAAVNNVERVPVLSLAQPGAFLPGSTTQQVNPNVQRFIPGFRSSSAFIIPGSATPDGFEIAQLQGTERTDENAFFGRLDYKYNDTNNFYIRYFRDKGTDLAPEGVSGRQVKIVAIPQNAAFGYTSVLNQSLINDFRIGFNAAKTTINGIAPIVNGVDFSNIIINVSGTTAQLPGNTIAGQGASAGISVPGGLVRANSATNGRGQPYTPFSLAFIDALSYTRGSHNTKFGTEIRRVQLKTDRLGGTTYTFSSFNNFLLGNLQQIQYVGDLSAPSPFTGVSGQRVARQTYYIFYGQDQWNIRPNLTISYGLRYEYYSPLREKSNGQIYFNIDNGTFRPSSADPFLSSKKNFGPRIAVTYSPFPNGSGFFGGNRTVIRAGFGIYYGPGQTEDQIQPIESDRISSTVTSGPLITAGFSGNPTADVNAIIANFNANPNNRSFQPRAYANNYKIPERINQYSISYQQQLPYNLVSTIAYVGSVGRNLFLRSVANRILPGNAVVSNTATVFPTGVGVINRVNTGGQVTGVTTVRQFSILNNAAACNASATNPICQPFAEIDYKTSGGRDRYDALQTSLARRFDNGLTMNAQYTYSYSRGNTSGSNDARTSAQLENFNADFGRNTFDVRHSFNLSALYDLPIGKGKRFDLGNSVANYLLGGWDIGGIINARSGLPIEVLVVRPDVVVQCQQAGGCPVNFAGGTTVPQGFVAQLPSFGANFPNLPTGFVAVVNTPGGGASRNVRRPDLISGVSPYLKNDRNILNPAAFAIPAPGTFGNLSRNALEGPSFRQFDLILSKRFFVTERANVQFRTEIFNVFNKANFVNPPATLPNTLPTLSYNAATGAFSANATSLQPGQPYSVDRSGTGFGQITSTVGRTVGLGTNRQIQFAVRLNF
jgi:hypothetical protein